MWSTIDYHFMTDESEGEGDWIVQHKLPWRSPSNHAPSNMLLTCYQPNVTCISMNIQSCSKYVSACSIRVKLPKVVVVSVKKASGFHSENVTRGGKTGLTEFLRGQQQS